ncbi:integral membrane sensor signal transduction histidine kinase [Methylobacterium sp. GXF4]|uniref:sensor histidine kinase n=1 Tax=Methylobacterium sp. GXF4 TaxID=1096546 RepID=UPI000269993C|nr:sensor histidine kinase [Methylobacterium sp. GXF4]EIZ85767.1 integral membrane sensor signal transduction histidine kinase [Methylobacterium sp. GXF4]
MPPPKKGPPPRRSLRTRLLAAALALVLAALVVAGLAIGVILHRFVRGQIEGHLDAQIVALRAGLEAGLLSQNRDAPPFDRDGPGWAWEVRRGAETYGSGSLRGGHITVTDPGPDDAADHPHPADGTGPRGERLILRILDVPGTPPATIIAAAPRAALYGPLREALTSLALALGVLGLCLIAGLALQVRLGLAPLRRLRADLAAVRAGRRERVPEEQPAEIKPLVSELNALLDQNAQNLERARGHVANLAHALKTPLATLSMALADRARDPDGALRLQVDDMDRRVRHHLRRARAAALSGSARGRTPLAPRVSDLRDALVRLYAEKGVVIDLAVPDALSVPCEGQDLDEMLGNLVDNACRWCRSRVRVVAVSEAGGIVVRVEDNGPGLDGAAAAAVMERGRRLDEGVPGHGFGLPITLELAELYGGGLTLGRSELGGLKAELTLPA